MMKAVPCERPGAVRGSAAVGFTGAQRLAPTTRLEPNMATEGTYEGRVLPTLRSERPQTNGMRQRSFLIYSLPRPLVSSGVPCADTGHIAHICCTGSARNGTRPRARASGADAHFPALCCTLLHWTARLLALLSDKSRLSFSCNTLALFKTRVRHVLKHEDPYLYA